MELNEDQKIILRGEVYSLIKENKINTITIRDLCEAKFRIRYKGNCVLPPTQRLLIAILSDLKSSGHIHQITKKTEIFYNCNDYSLDYEVDSDSTDENTETSDEDVVQDANFSEISEPKIAVALCEDDEKEYNMEIEMNEEFLKTMSDDVDDFLPGSSVQGVNSGHNYEDSSLKNSKRSRKSSKSEKESSGKNTKQRKKKTPKPPLESLNAKVLESLADAGVYIIDGKVVRDEELSLIHI